MLVVIVLCYFMHTFYRLMRNSETLLALDKSLMHTQARCCSMMVLSRCRGLLNLQVCSRVFCFFNSAAVIPGFTIVTFMSVLLRLLDWLLIITTTKRCPVSWLLLLPATHGRKMMFLEGEGRLLFYRGFYRVIYVWVTITTAIILVNIVVVRL